LATALVALACSAGKAHASHFRYGAVAWTVPNPVSAPRAVTFTVTIGVTTPLSTLPFTFGDGTTATMTGVSIGTGTDAAGSLYNVYQYTTSHTYLTDGPFTAFHSSSARIAGLVNGNGGTYRIQAVVALGGSPVNTSGPAAGSPTIIMLQAGGTRSFTWPVLDPDGDSFSCRFGTTTESALPAGQTVPAVPAGGAVPTLTATATGCTMTWDLMSAVAGQQYVIHVEFESTHNAVKSSSDIDTIVQITTGAPPAVSGSGVFTATAGQPLTIPFTGTWTGGISATVSSIGLPAGATVTPGGSALSPFSNSLDWTPPASQRGKSTIVFVNYKTTTNLVGTGYALINVLPCTSACTGATPVCDPITLNCVACLNDASCAAPTPRCTAGRICAECVTDAHCGTGNWCNDLGAANACAVRAPNGAAVPGGTCTVPLGARACATGKCDADNLCGWATGTPGCAANTSAPECRTGMCASDGTCGSGPPATITASLGATQTQTVNLPFGSPLEVLVQDTTGLPVKNAVVTFTAPATGASAVLGAMSAMTDATGHANVTASASTTAGSYVVSASVSGVSIPATFALSNLAGAASAIAVDSGGGQTTTVGTAFGVGLTALVTDAFGNAVSGVNVSFSAPSSGASTALAPGGAMTDGTGRAAVTATANGVAGAYAVTASTDGVATPASFGLGNAPGAPALIAIVSGTGQSAVVGTAFTPLTVIVTDAFGNPAPLAPVTFSPSGGAASVVLDSTTATTDAGGLASVTATANTVSGGSSVVASGGVSMATFTLTNLAGAAASIAVVSGSNQSQTVGSAFAAPLVAVVRDGYENLVPGVAVTFTAPGTGASAALAATSAMTDATGQASVTASANTTAGSYLMSASVSGVASPATFALSNVAGAASAIAVDSGGGQTTTVGAAFGAALTVLVTDPFGNPASGVNVSFSAPSSGASTVLAPGGATTDGAGRAAVTATANGVAGAYAVTASTGGVATPAAFGLSNAPGAPAAIAIVSGSGQSAPVGTAFAPLTVMMSDAFGNPTPGATVTFSPSGGGGPAVALASTTASTGAGGLASVIATANTVSGGSTVVASGGGSTATFTLTNLPGAATSIAVVGGSNQSQTVGSAYPAPLVAVVRDGNQNPVPGVAVTFTAPGAGASAVPAMNGVATTDSSGYASVNIVANTSAGGFTMTATAPGVTTAAAFALTNTAGPAATLTLTDGDGQRVAVTEAFPNKIRVTVRDTSGNPAPNAVVGFVAPAPGAGVATASLSAGNVTTDNDGVAGVDAVSNAVAGAYEITVRVLGTTPVVARLRNLPGAPASIAPAPGSTPQAATVREPFTRALAAIVLDAHDNPVPGVTVTFAAPSGTASALLSGGTATTDAAGTAQVAATALAEAGSYTVLGSVAGVGANAAFQLANLSGQPSKIETVGGTPQAATVAGAFAQPLAVKVSDADGNPVPGAIVTFTSFASTAGATAVLGAPAAATDTAGHAEVSVTAGTLAGVYTVTAQTSGGAHSAEFTLTNQPGPAAHVVADARSTPQASQVSVPFTQPLVVTVTDAYGNAVPGVTVAFTGPADGATAAVSPASGDTGATGQVSVTVTAGQIAGAFTINAAVAGVATPAAFALRNLVGPPHNISVVSGSGQTAEVTTAFAGPLVAALRDAYGNPISGATLTVSTPSSGATATVGGDAAVTGADGRASIAVTATTVAGAYIVTVGSAMSTSSAVFTLTNLPGAPAQLVADASSTRQTAEAEHPFPQALRATVKDSHDNPVPGVRVLFTAPAAGATAALATAGDVTDMSGEVAVNATAGSALGAYTVTASVEGTTLSASYALTNLSGRPALLALVSGGGQHARAGAAFDLPLVFSVRDGHGLVVSGASVALALPATGPSGVTTTSSATADDEGQVRFSLSANDVPGSFQVTASVLGATTPVVVPLTIDPIATMVALQASATDVEVGSSIDLAVTASADVGTPGGEIKLALADGTLLGMAALAGGQATVSVPATTALIGTLVVTARLDAQGSYAAGTSAPVTITVRPKPSTGSLGGAGGCDCSTSGVGAGHGSGSVAGIIGLLAALVARRRRKRA
jgi:MYXO-CTERM domain-containing protein